uniref:hypothetical protein n=1 Tax=Arthrobacter silvisoli TaxID=2291022 RepID=UPI003F496ED8
MSTESTSTTETTSTTEEQSGEQNAQTFTQADVDRIVRERLVQQAKNKFGDYDELKSKAGESTSLEQRVADMEARASAAETAALRATVAAEYGISTKKGPKGEPSDADLFLTGNDEATLTAQAQRLADREADRKKQGNFAPKEGSTTSTGKDDGESREFVRNLFGTTD